MNLQFGEKYEQLRAEVRAFCAESWPLQGAEARLGRASRRRLAQARARGRLSSTAPCRARTAARARSRT